MVFVCLILDLGLEGEGLNEGGDLNVLMLDKGGDILDERGCCCWS